VAWKGVHLSRPARLTHKDRQLVIALDDGEVRAPLEDVAFVVLDTPQATLTSALLAACMEAGIAIVSTNARHHPNGVALPFHRHHRQAGIAEMQIATSAPLKKRLWQRLVQAKIENQAAALAACGRFGGDGLRAMAGLVGSGDPDNVEARAAREYWGRLFDGFRREDEGDRRNMALNYGYAVVRAAIARALVAGGLLPCFGLRHASVSNAFNLADDLLEPFRPFVDRRVPALVADGGGELTIEDRRALAAILTAEARIGGETVTLLVATEAAAESLVRAMQGRSAALLRLPVLVGGDR
jgi:CRISPR-associated protein Cas1